MLIVDVIILTIPSLLDNYTYLIIDPRTKLAAVVDPVDVGAVLNAVRLENAELDMVLTTHHHW
jgi:hydroxyacylglutathione hydrolase